MSAFILLVFLTGGSARSDVQSLAFLRPVAALMCGYALWSFGQQHWQQYRVLLLFAGAVLALLLLQLAPLPPAIWQALPGRNIIVEAEQAAGLTSGWRPMTMVPSLTTNALFALLVPIACLLHVIQLNNDDRIRLLWLLLGIGLFSGVIGMMQAVGSSSSPLYFYRITNSGSAVGLFANRNHHAAFLSCMFPLLAVMASLPAATPEAAKIRLALGGLAGIVLIPLLLVTGSRAGLVLGLLGLISVALLYRTPESAKAPRRGFAWRRILFLGGGLSAIGIALLTVLFARAEAFERITSPDQTEDLRWQMWGPIADMAGKYMPFGSGAGSFVEVYQLDEPHALLLTRYVNQAHNDWLDLALTSGIPGLLLLALAIFLWIRAALAVWFRSPTPSRRRQMARAASVVILIFGLASLGDYPLRVPSLASFFVIAAVWLAAGKQNQANALSESKKMDGNDPSYRLAG